MRSDILVISHWSCILPVKPRHPIRATTGFFNKNRSHIWIFICSNALSIMKDCFVIFLDYYFANTCMCFPNTLIHIRYFHTNTYASCRVIWITTCELLFIITYFALSTHTSLPHWQDRERGFAWRSATDGRQPIVYIYCTAEHTYVTMGNSSPSKIWSAGRYTFTV